MFNKTLISLDQWFPPIKDFNKSQLPPDIDDLIILYL